MPLGMEMMLSNMIGMKPDELKKAAEFTLATIQKAANDLEEIKQRLSLIETSLTNEEDENGGRKHTGNGDCHHVQL